MNVHRNDFHRADPYRHFVPVAVAAPVTLPTAPIEPWFRTRKVGGLRFIWCGRLVVSFCISQPGAAARKAQRKAAKIRRDAQRANAWATRVD